MLKKGIATGFAINGFTGSEAKNTGAPLKITKNGLYDLNGAGSVDIECPVKTFKDHELIRGITLPLVGAITIEGCLFVSTTSEGVATWTLDINFYPLSVYNQLHPDDDTLLDVFFIPNDSKLPLGLTIPEDLSRDNLPIMGNPEIYEVWKNNQSSPIIYKYEDGELVLNPELYEGITLKIVKSNRETTLKGHTAYEIRTGTGWSKAKEKGSKQYQWAGFNAGWFDPSTGGTGIKWAGMYAPRQATVWEDYKCSIKA